MWLGAAIAVVSAACSSPCSRRRWSRRQRARAPNRRAEPVLWAIGGGAGPRLGAVVASWLSRRALAGRPRRARRRDRRSSSLVVVGYNSTDLRFEDQLVGSLLIVVLPGLRRGRSVFAWLAAFVARLFGGRRAAPVTGSSPTT